MTYYLKLSPQMVMVKTVTNEGKHVIDSCMVGRQDVITQI